MFKVIVEDVNIVMCECGEIMIVDNETFCEMIDDGVLEYGDEEYVCDCEECQEDRAFEEEALRRGFVKLS